MAWNGYYEFGGTEIINVQRTEAYAATLPGFIPVYNNTQLQNPDYENPEDDDAPWFDEVRPESGQFFGAYPLNITGIEDSTGIASVVESTIDGGVVGTLRRTSRTVVVNVVLLAASEAGASYGLAWLRTALVGGACFGRSDSQCGGNDLCYFDSEPLADSDLDYLHRSLREVSVTNGPNVIAKYALSCGGYAWNVQFTLIAGDPAEYGKAVEVFANFMKAGVSNPYVGGTPSGGSFDLTGDVMEEVECRKNQTVILTDPECPVIIAPPAVPNVDITCFDFPEEFRRRQIVVPAQMIPLWGNIAPQIRLHASAEVRNLRLRFYADPYEVGSPDEDPCNFCGDLVVSYLPQNATLVLDGVSQTIYAELQNGRRQRADSLVYGSDGKPFQWPELSCGTPYIFTADLPTSHSGARPGIDLSLYAKVA